MILIVPHQDLLCPVMFGYHMVMFGSKFKRDEHDHINSCGTAVYVTIRKVVLEMLKMFKQLICFRIPLINLKAMLIHTI